MNEKINYIAFPDLSPAKTIDNVIQELCHELGTDLYSLNKKNRERELVDKRHIFMYVLNKYLRLTTIRVGEITERNHCTVIHACYKVENLKLLNNYATNFKKYTLIKLLNEKQV